MWWTDSLKQAGVSLHVITTGAAAGLQEMLWQVPGSSSYLSGASFPYAQDEQEQLLGFMPEHFVSKEAAVDLASAAYMNAYRFGGKKAVGLGITASVASEKEHRGEHRVHACIITDDRVRVSELTLVKGSGEVQRKQDGEDCDELGLALLLDTVCPDCEGAPTYPYQIRDATELARQRFFERPFFAADGKRYKTIPNVQDYALMPGTFNPPHKGHFGLANQYRRSAGRNVVFEIGTKPPHKAPPTVQELLQRAKLLRGYDAYFTTDIALYIEKAKAFPGMPIILGADTLLRIFDPKWGVDINEMLETFRSMNTKFAVTGRLVDGNFVSGWQAVVQVLPGKLYKYSDMFVEMDGRWDVSSSELRAKL